MKEKYFLLWLFFFFGINSTTNSFCQILSFQAGANYGNQFAIKSDDAHESNEFEWGSGFSLGISLSEIPFKSKRSYTLCVGLESFCGGFDSGYFGLGGGYNKSGHFQKYVIDFEVYLWKIKLLQNLFVSPGLEINGTVGKKVSGKYSEYQMGNSIPDIDLTNYKGLVGPLNVGLNANLCYQFKFHRITVTPSYKFLFFFLPELNLSAYSFSHRHSFLISFGYSLK